MTFPTINRWENGRAKPSPLARERTAALPAELYEQMAEGEQLDAAIRRNLEVLGYGQ